MKFNMNLILGLKSLKNKNNTNNNNKVGHRYNSEGHKVIH